MYLDVEATRAQIERMGFSFEKLKEAMSSYPSLPVTSNKADMREDFVTGYIAAKQAVDHFGQFTECLSYIHSIGGRLSLENSHLYERLRLSYGELRPNHLAPGHAFRRHEIFDLISFCELVVNYRFEAVLVQHPSRAWIAFARDECMYFVAEQ